MSDEYNLVNWSSELIIQSQITLLALPLVR